jgi:hypothetical protein
MTNDKGNPKSETRNPKQARNSKFQLPKTHVCAAGTAGVSCFVIPSSFDIWISSLSIESFLTEFAA